MGISSCLTAHRIVRNPVRSHINTSHKANTTAYVNSLHIDRPIDRGPGTTHTRKTTKAELLAAELVEWFTAPDEKPFKPELVPTPHLPKGDYNPTIS
jgi:hypothetical protein